MAAAWVARAGRALAVRPDLWVTALRQIAVLARPRWWKRAPFLPLPDRAYFEFRMQTMYGAPDHAPEPHDVVTYLQWCKAWPAVTDAG